MASHTKLTRLEEILDILQSEKASDDAKEQLFLEAMKLTVEVKHLLQEEREEICQVADANGIDVRLLFSSDDETEEEKS